MRLRHLIILRLWLSMCHRVEDKTIHLHARFCGEPFPATLNGSINATNYGRGGGVGRTLGVACGLGVGVGLGVVVGVAVGVDVGVGGGVVVVVGVEVGVKVAVAVAVAVAVGVGLAVGVDVGVNVAVAVTVAVGVSVGVEVGVGRSQIIWTESILQPGSEKLLSLPIRHRSTMVCPPNESKSTAVVIKPPELPVHAWRPASGLPQQLLIVPL